MTPIVGYDFDNTVYRGDSSTHFTFWCLAHYPKTWLHLPAMAFWGLLFGLKLCPKTRFKSHLFGYLRHIRQPEQAVERFWQSHRKNLKAWYLARPHGDDVIISASGEFLLAPVCAELGVKRLHRHPDGQPHRPHPGGKLLGAGKSGAAPAGLSPVPHVGVRTPIPAPIRPWPRWRTGLFWSRATNCCPGEYNIILWI